MALNDVPLEDAGRNYYSQKFDAGIRSVRKGGAAPAPAKGARAVGGAIGGAVVAVFFLIRIIIGVAAGVSSSSSSYQSSYDFDPPPQIIVDPQPPADFNNGLMNPQPNDERFPWLNQDPPLVVPPAIGEPPADPFVLPPDNPPPVEDPNPAPPAPGDDRDPGPNP